MANTDKIHSHIAKNRETLQITPSSTMETVNDLLEIVDLKLADASTGGGGSQVNWGDVQGKPNMDDYAKKTDLESYAQKTELLKKSAFLFTNL